LPADKIAAMIAAAEDRPPAKGEIRSLLVNQAMAAQLISGSRFLVRRLVRDGKNTQVFLTPDCVRYSRAELEKLAAGGDHV
jgi:hypothetical protein